MNEDESLHFCHRCDNWSGRCKAGIVETANYRASLRINYRYFMPWERHDQTGVFVGGYMSRCSQYQKKFVK